MRVLFVIHELSLNGAVTTLVSQVRHLVAAGARVTVVTPELEGAAAALRADILAAGAHLVTETTTDEHDVAVGCTIFAADALAGMVGRLPLVWRIHEGLAGARYVLADPKALALLSAVDKLVFPSRGAVERMWAPLLSGLPPGRVAVVPPLLPPPEPGDAAPKAAGRKRVLCVGSIEPRKRQGDLVRAMAIFGPTAPVECVLVGERLQLDPPVDAIVAAHPERFILPGALPPAEVQRLYRSADIFALPSGDESLAQTPIQAAWHGVPVVLSDLDCYAGVWKHGVNALLHPVGEVELLAWYLRMLIASPTLGRRLASAALGVAAGFGPAHTTALFAALLEGVAAQRAGRRAEGDDHTTR